MGSPTLGERDRVAEELKKEVHAPELPEVTSVYDLVNAMTAAAHDSEPARRLGLETVAGGFLQRQVAELAALTKAQASDLISELNGSNGGGG